MSRMTLTIDAVETAFLPGDIVHCATDWTLDLLPRQIEARLFWHTQGKGTTDMVIVASAICPTPTLSGRWTFDLQLPSTAPFTYSGRLLSLMWAIEVVADEKAAFARQELMVSPTGAPIVPHEGVA